MKCASSPSKAASIPDETLWALHNRNKSALLQAVLKRHLEQVAEAVERVCREQEGNSLTQIGPALINAFLDAKMKDPKTSVAFYAVSSDVDGVKIVQRVRVRTNRAIVGVLASAREPLRRDPQVVASMLQSAMFGVSRRLLESSTPEKELKTMREELIYLVSTYLEACSAPLAE